MSTKILERPDGSRRVMQINDEPDKKAKQSMKKDCDINNILRKYKKTGHLPELIKRNAQYGDFSQIEDYQTSLNTVKKAQEQFDSLSAEVRKKFENDPAKMLDFVSNPENIEEMYNLGLAVKPEEINEEPVIDEKQVEEVVKDESTSV